MSSLRQLIREEKARRLREKQPTLFIASTTTAAAPSMPNKSSEISLPQRLMRQTASTIQHRVHGATVDASPSRSTAIEKQNSCSSAIPSTIATNLPTVTHIKVNSVLTDDTLPQAALERPAETPHVATEGSEADLRQSSFLPIGFFDDALPTDTEPIVAAAADIGTKSTLFSTDSLYRHFDEEDIETVEYDIIEPDAALLQPATDGNASQLWVRPTTTDLKPHDVATAAADDPSKHRAAGFASIQQEEVEYEEMQFYQPLDTAFHSEVLSTADSLAGDSKAPSTSVDKRQQTATTTLPVGFFDDADADAEARGLEGPTKRRKHDLESEYKKFASLMDIEVYKRELRQSLLDTKRHAQDWEDQKDKQKAYEAQVQELKKRWQRQQSHVPIKVESSEEWQAEIEEPSDSEWTNEVLDWRSKALY